MVISEFQEAFATFAPFAQRVQGIQQVLYVLGFAAVTLKI